MFTENELRAHLTHPLPALHLYDTIDSTNTCCKQLAEMDALEGTVVIAGHQTAGRGRMGRSFFSPADTGLYMTLLLRPTLSPTEALSITTCAAVCVSEAIEAIAGIPAQIKWVNDVFVAGKKVCGILTEAAFSPAQDTLRYALLGIGVNLTAPDGDFPPELTDIASAIWERTDLDLRPRLAAGILDRFFSYYPHLAEKPFYDGYRDRLFLRGKTVQILWGEHIGTGTCIDVDRDFRLLVQREDGTMQSHSSGEVRVKLS